MRSKQQEYFLEEDRMAMRLLPLSLVIGVAAGAVISLYRYLIPLVAALFLSLYSFGRQNLFAALAVAAVLIGVGLPVGWMLKKEPMITGSGIPQVRGTLQGSLRMGWWRILLFKFLGGLASLGAGLTLGREGPSIQMGAAIGQGVSKWTRRKPQESRHHIVSGAAAGLSAGFNAPLSGVVFAVEEMHHGFPPFALVTAMGASLSANFVSAWLFGLDPVIKMPVMLVPTLPIYILMPFLGVFAGLSGILFNWLIAAGKRLYGRLKLPVMVRALIPFIGTGLVILANPALFGSGEELMFLPMLDNPSLSVLIFLYLAKLALLLLAFCAGLPGGIFFPMLVLGSLVGNIFGSAAVALGLIGSDWILHFTILAMSAHFTAIVRAPLTGMMLMIELTASFQFLLPLGIVTFVAYITAQLAHSVPVYDSLLEFMVNEKTASRTQVQKTVSSRE